MKQEQVEQGNPESISIIVNGKQVTLTFSEAGNEVVVGQIKSILLAFYVKKKLINIKT